ncbi:DUF1775 domain-containing protein [Streptomyces sp. NPDC055078]
MSNVPLPSAVRRTALAAAVALGTVLAVAAPAAAHAGVTASDDRALAKNVTLTFTSEAESDKAGIAKLQIVLPEGISPGAVTLKKAPAGWKLSQAQGGYIIGGKALPTGKDAVYSIVVKQLPAADSLVFKTVETYADGKEARWIEVPKNGAKAANPAPLLKLKPAAKGAKPESVPQGSGAGSGTSAPGAPGAGSSSSAKSAAPSVEPSSPHPRHVIKKRKDGLSALNVVVIVVVVVIAGGVIVWVLKRRPGASS